ncbi:MAG: HupE/UreJ family protein [Rhodoblastus sp.]|nr:HupE/UreJ family protein [Rhodoblastus sp.]
MKANPIAGAALVFLGATAPALAHTGHSDAHGFVHGFIHPVGGIDHVLAMVAVGLFAAHLGGRALWAVPSAFVALMAVGGALGMNGVSLPYVEAGIALSVVVFGLMLATGVALPVGLAAGLVGFFAIFHGQAHGAELPAGVSGVTYAAGFMIATAALHGAGVALGLGAGRLASMRALRIGGAAMAASGVGLLAGWI